MITVNLDYFEEILTKLNHESKSEMWGYEIQIDNISYKETSITIPICHTSYHIELEAFDYVIENILEQIGVTKYECRLDFCVTGLKLLISLNENREFKYHRHIDIIVNESDIRYKFYKEDLKIIKEENGHIEIVFNFAEMTNSFLNEIIRRLDKQFPQTHNTFTLFGNYKYVVLRITHNSKKYLLNKDCD